MHFSHLNGEYPDWIYFDYVWEAEWPVEYFLGKTVDINAFPLGSFSNFHTYLTNIAPAALRYKDDILDRNKDPGAGAFSYFIERNFTATRVIAAGEEIFVDYGDLWLADHSMEKMPRKEDYEMLDKIVRKFPEHIKKDNMDYGECLSSSASTGKQTETYFQTEKIFTFSDI